MSRRLDKLEESLRFESSGGVGGDGGLDAGGRKSSGHQVMEGAA